VVLEESGFWGVYFDIDQNGLSKKGAGRVVIEIELLREETRGVPIKKDNEGMEKAGAREEVKEEARKGEGLKVEVDAEAAGTVECEMAEEGKVEVEKLQSGEQGIKDAGVSSSETVQVE